MVDGYIEVSGKELPFRRTLGAMKRFDERFKGEFSILEAESKMMNIAQVIALLYLFVEAGYKSLGKPCEIDEEWFEDNVTQTDLEKITYVLRGKPEETDTKKNEPRYKGSTGNVKVPLTR